MQQAGKGSPAPKDLGVTEIPRNIKRKNCPSMGSLRAEGGNCRSDSFLATRLLLPCDSSSLFCCFFLARTAAPSSCFSYVIPSYYHFRWATRTQELHGILVQYGAGTTQKTTNPTSAKRSSWVSGSVSRISGNRAWIGLSQKLGARMTCSPHCCPRARSMIQS